MPALLTSLALPFKLLHVFFAFWFVSGLIGRWVTMKQAENDRSIYNTLALVTTAGIFERWMVIPGGMIVIILGIITALLQGWPLLGFLQGGRSNWLLASLLLFLSLNIIVFTVFLPRGKAFDQALQDAATRGDWTASLANAFCDPVTRAAHIYEFACIAGIVFLMVAKPF